MYNMASLDLHCEAVLVLSTCLLSVIVDVAVKLGNAHERQTCLFLILCLMLQRLRGELWGERRGVRVALI